MILLLAEPSADAAVRKAFRKQPEWLESRQAKLRLWSTNGNDEVLQIQREMHLEESSSKFHFQGEVGSGTGQGCEKPTV